MKMTSFAVAICLTIAGVTPVCAEQRPAETRPSPVVIENTGDGPLACGLLFAHWYRQDFPVIAPGSSVTLPLDLAPATEAVYVVNSVKQPMAVQDLFCAKPGADWSRVTHLDYRALSLKAVGAPVTIRCAGGDDGISCQGLSF